MRKKHSHMNHNLEEIQEHEEKLKKLIETKLTYKDEDYTLLSFARHEITLSETCPNTSTPEISYCIICDLQNDNGEKVKVFSDEILPFNL